MSVRKYPILASYFALSLAAGCSGDVSDSGQVPGIVPVGGSQVPGATAPSQVTGSPAAVPGAASPSAVGGPAAPGVAAGPGIIPGGPGVGGGAQGAPVTEVSGAACEVGRLMPTRIWRLNDRQFHNAAQDLLPGVTIPEIATAGRDDHEFVSVEGRYLIDNGFTSQLQGVVEDISGQAAQQAEDLTGCAGANAACVQEFSRSFAERAYRRPLQASERDAIDSLFALGSDPTDGFSLVVEGVLQSPSFLYRSELGAPGAAPGPTRLTGYEMASSLSFFFLDSIPDADLLAAAASGNLDTDAGIAVQVERLMADEGVQDHVTELVMSWLELPSVYTIEKDENLFEFDFDGEARQSIFDEARSFVHNVLWTGGSVSDLLTSRQTWATGVAAEILNVPESDGQPNELAAGERAGLLTRPAMLAAVPSGNNQVVYRGRILREVLLCGVIPDPPATLDTDAINEQLAGATERERMDQRAADASCRGCHAFLDPLGISMEVFGHVGERVAGGVDAAGDLSLTDVDGPFTNIVDLSERLAGSTTVRECVSQQMASYALGQFLNSAQDRCTNQQVAASISTPNSPLKEVFKGIALSTAFTTRMQGASQ